MRRRKKLLILSMIILIIGIMVLFYLIKEENRFVSENEYHKNVTLQKQMNSETIHQLNEYGITDTSELKLEYFFYTNENNKANNLAIDLKKLGFQINKVDKSEIDKNLWVINGWSNKIKMDVQSVSIWTTLMCKIGYNNDCDFDGWGTLPDQNFEIEKNLTAIQYYNKGLDLYYDKELRKSELYFTESINLDPTFPVSYYNRANVRTELGNTSQALEDYNSAIKIKPNYQEAFENRGALKDELGDYDGAISDYNEALKINPKSTISYINRGNSKYRKGDNGGACVDWKKALELGDKSSEGKINEYCK